MKNYILRNHDDVYFMSVKADNYKEARYQFSRQYGGTGFTIIELDEYGDEIRRHKPKNL